MFTGLARKACSTLQIWSRNSCCQAMRACGTSETAPPCSQLLPVNLTPRNDDSDFADARLTSSSAPVSPCSANPSLSAYIQLTAAYGAIWKLVPKLAFQPTSP